MIVPLILESKHELPHAKKIMAVLEDYGVRHELYFSSAHKAPKTTLEILDKYNEMKESVVIVSVTEGSNVLSAFLSANTHFPVIACPSGASVASTLPNETPMLTVLDPENAGQAVVRLLGLTNKDLAKKVKNHIKVVNHGFSSNPVSLDD